MAKDFPRSPSRSLAISANANRAIEDLTKRFPQNTVVQTRYLPMARSALALNSGNAQAAIEALSPAAPYELGHTNEDFTFALYPIYLRGQAYLAAKNGAAAAGEFQKILDQPASWEMNQSAPSPIWELLGPTHLSGTPPKPRLLMTISSPCGKMPTRMFHSQASEGGVRETALNPPSSPFGRAEVRDRPCLVHRHRRLLEVAHQRAEPADSKVKEIVRGNRTGPARRSGRKITSSAYR